MDKERRWTVYGSKIIKSDDKTYTIRNIKSNSDVWFVAKDIGDLLGYRDANSTTRQIKFGKKDYLNIETNGGTQKMIGFNKIALHELLQYSRKLNQVDKITLYETLTESSYYDTISKTNKEIEFLTKLKTILSYFNLHPILQKTILCYRIDCYITELNVAIEYDENNHRSYIYEHEEQRQCHIEREIGCRFIRVSDDKSDEENIGIVLKELGYILNKSS